MQKFIICKVFLCSLLYSYFLFYVLEQLVSLNNQHTWSSFELYKNTERTMTHQSKYLVILSFHYHLRIHIEFSTSFKLFIRVFHRVTNMKLNAIAVALLACLNRFEAAAVDSGYSASSETEATSSSSGKLLHEKIYKTQVPQCPHDRTESICKYTYAVICLEHNCKTHFAGIHSSQASV